MVPVYSIACTVSVEFYKQNVYLASIYEFYESLVIAAFFLLLCQLLHPDRITLQRAFSLVEPKPWIHPIRFLVVHIGRRKDRSVDGLKWFNASLGNRLREVVANTKCALDNLVLCLPILRCQVSRRSCKMYNRGCRCVLRRVEQCQSCQDMGMLAFSSTRVP